MNNPDYYMDAYIECKEGLIIKDNIVKHSKNIKKLIKTGDYINGQEVIEIRKQNGKMYLMTSYVPQKYIAEEIKTIVTKEQMQSIEYKVEENK